MKKLSTLSRTYFRTITFLVVVLSVLSVSNALGQSTACVGLDPAGNPATSGLYAEYYTGYFQDNQRFFSTTQPGLARVDGQVNFPSITSFGDIMSIAGVAGSGYNNPDMFSVRQRGSLRINTAGTYTFYFTTDDAAYLWLDNAAANPNPTAGSSLLNNGGIHIIQTVQKAVYLTAGLHNLLIHYGDSTIENVLILEYENRSAGITRQVVPASQFCTGTQPIRNLPSALNYTPAIQTVPAGTTATSVVPTVTSATTPRYVVANASSLPSGLTIDPNTGQLSVSAAVEVGTYVVNVAVTNAEGAVTFDGAYTFIVAAAAPNACAGTRPDGGPATGGLFAEYYAGYFNDDPAFFTAKTPSFNRLDTQLNFTTDNGWGNLATVATFPASNPANPDAFSARYRGRILVEKAGKYTFYLTADDGARLWLDDAAVQASVSNKNAFIDNGGQHPVKMVSATVTLAAGPHDLLLHYGDATSDNRLILEYSSTDAGIERQVIPASAFCSSVSPTRQPVVPIKGSKDLLTVSPNPNSGKFIVHIEQNQPASGQLHLIDVSGRLCFKLDVEGAAKQEVNVSLPDLPVGMYLLRLITADGTSMFKVSVQ
ncbi:PA14 domain-containing protein [Hymenobacter tibetensis]|uniref:PA14 domain-containing protein n=1 Tax=Hymenobacter tibetensis TaxID=497967 RepID=A0ABY4CYF8_9BACT|nr:PA14 domain-containing protein [Hymenobacter tibetensis]UOG75306.1 PA14 domain-containing protein [Hymenobacter tibetensis]